ncbi:MAG TPA: hypothetical protein VND65_18200 [Candidatus Binatia bacterium]|nr:hypothetical protein [Candidatus Binatia bacterium]
MSSPANPPILAPTAGFVSPGNINSELNDLFLHRFLNRLVSGIVTTIDSSNVRPRWQPEPGNEPDFETDWCAIGVIRRTRDVNTAELLVTGSPATGFTFTPLGSDLFHRPNENPLDPDNWKTVALQGTLSVVGNQCVPGLFSGVQIFIGAAAPNDQFVSVEIGALAGFEVIYARSNVAAVSPTGYAALIQANGQVALVLNAVTVLKVVTVSISRGDIFTLAAVGSTIAILQNGTIIIEVTDTTIASGETALEIRNLSSQGDTSATLFQMGIAGGVPLTRVVRNQILEIIASFYGPNSDANSELFAMGLGLAQNREALLLNGFGLIEVQDTRTVPALIKERWLAGQDVPFRMRRQQIYDYPTAVLAAANGTLTLDDGEVIQISVPHE